MAEPISRRNYRANLGPFVPGLEADARETLDLVDGRFNIDHIINDALAIVPDPNDGALWIESAAAFDQMAGRTDVPGVQAVREVKFIVIGIGREDAKIVFMHSGHHALHAYFARDILQIPLSSIEFTRRSYFSADRDFLAGTIVFHESYDTAPMVERGLYALEFWPTDPVPPDMIIRCFALAAQAMPFVGERLAYHPSGYAQEQAFVRDADRFAASGVPTVSTDELFEHIQYNPLNLGETVGRLTLFDPDRPAPPTIRDIIIYTRLPNDLPHVAGIISSEPQTPLSHVNLRARQNDTPNAYLFEAENDPALVPHLGNIIRMAVTPDKLEVVPATLAEQEAFLTSARPDQIQVPKRVLERRDILPLDALGLRDIVAFGGKSANLGELRKILPPAVVPDGYAIPFAFYHDFMTANGLYDVGRDMRAAPEFQRDALIREDKLKEFRKLIKDAAMSPTMRERIGELQNAFPTGTTLRCRSSANNEDLVGFTGAGLYDSYTHHLDEGHLEKSIKQVWSSLWSFRAFDERDFYRIDHEIAAMGVLVHPNYEDELVNGVALTKNLYFPNFDGYYVNCQLGEDRVTNPEGDFQAEEFLALQDINFEYSDAFEFVRIRPSNLVPSGEWVLQSEHRNALITHLRVIHRHYAGLYGRTDDRSFAMDVEFKVDKDNQLSIKQARPWVD